MSLIMTIFYIINFVSRFNDSTYFPYLIIRTLANSIDKFTTIRTRKVEKHNKFITNIQREETMKQYQYHTQQVKQ